MTTTINDPTSPSAQILSHTGETEHDAVEDSAADRLGLYRELFERSADAILVIEDGTFIECNQATVDMLRYTSREELLQTHPSQLSPEFQPDGRTSFDKANEMMAIALEKKSHRFERDHMRADGEVFPVEVLLTTIPKGEGLIIHTVWRDITDRKRLQNELQQAHKLEAIGKLAGGIAHDFNNLLVAILGNSELLEMDLEPESPLLEYVGEIQRAGQRAARLVEQLLAYSRKQMLRTMVLDLNEVLTGLSPMLRHLLGEDIVVKMTLCPQTLAVRADSGQLERIVMNLATNARDAMHEGGVLHLETMEIPIQNARRAGDRPLNPGRYAALKVTDAGHGIDERIMNKIFDPFFTTKPHGTGLGLSTVFGIVRQSGGDVKVSSSSQNGTVFTVYLPLTEEAPTPIVQENDSAVGRARPGETVLLVEDEPSIALFVERILSDDGYTVHTAVDGRHALALLEENDFPFDLLLTDVIMPNMGGPELARQLQKRYPDMQVLYASGYTNEALTTRGVLDEGVELIQKPYSAKQLKRKIRELLDAD